MHSADKAGSPHPRRGSVRPRPANAKPFRGASVTIVQATSGSSRVDVRGVISAIASLAFVRFVPPVPGYSFLIVSSAVEKGKAGMLVIRRPFHRFLASSSCQFL